MKTKQKKTPDYWGLLFVGCIFLTSLGGFMITNHGGDKLDYASTSSRIETIRFNDVGQIP